MSSSFLKRIDFLLKRNEVIFLGALAALTMIVYLAYSAWANGTGFPLDDAWIHQTYARNLAARGEWAFVPDQPSAGATSPLWVALLAIGHFLGLGPFIWTFILGWLCLWAIGILSGVGFARLIPRQRKIAVWVGALVVIEWHMVWAAASGMETALFTAFCTLTLLLVFYEGRTRSTVFFTLAGLLVGLAVFVRPEGLTLLAPLMLAVLLSESVQIEKFKAVVSLFLGFALLFIPYLLFNHAIAGSFWPNTFYAKQAEYAVLNLQPFWRRLGQELFQPLVGAGTLLAPGFFYALVRAAKEKLWSTLLCAAWAIGFLALFAWRLPTVYQHGRYTMPVIPIYFLVSAFGVARWIARVAKTAWRRQLNTAWVQGLVLISLLMYAVAAPVYARDVAFINTEMVATAVWVNANTPADSLIAAHDIGALGYFAQRPILDLAGLVSPEVIPFIRDEAQLKRYLDQQGADYLVSFPDWYPQLTKRAVLVYQSRGEIGPALGEESMAVYLWPVPAH